MSNSEGTVELPDVKRTGMLSILNGEPTQNIFGSIQLRGIDAASTISIGQGAVSESREPKQKTRRR